MQGAITKAEQNSAHQKAGKHQHQDEDDEQCIYACADIHKLPFADSSFDTVIDTFGLECAYDLDQAWTQIKRMTKPGGKIMLLERGMGFWFQDNFQMMRKASLNLGARG